MFHPTLMVPFRCGRLPMAVIGLFASPALVSAGTGGDSGGHGKVTIQSLAQLRARVMDHNWDILGKVLDYESKRRAFEAEKGLFDPSLALGYLHEDSRRPNTVQQRRELEGVPQLNQRNNLYNTGLETLTPLGTKLGLTASVSEFRNNLQSLDDPSIGANGDKDVVSFIGVTLTQPLLRDAGAKTATAALRVAASQSEQAYQDFRRQLMVSLSSAELAYWNLAAAERQVTYYQASLGLARQIEGDARTEVTAEKSPPLKLTTATAGVEERRARLLVSQQRQDEARAVLAGFCGAELSGFRVVTATPPAGSGEGPAVADAIIEALEANPDYLARRAVLEAEEVRAAYAKNQLLPRLDLKAAVGLNGLGSSISPSLDDIGETTFPAWSIGFELRYPLGNREAINRQAAALVAMKKADADLSEVRLSLANAIQNGVQKVRSARGAIAAYDAAVQANREILDSGLVELKEGKTELRRVLEAEEDLNQAQVSAVAGRVAYQQAALELELASGRVLRNRGVEMSKDEVAHRTAALVKARSISDASVRSLMSELRNATPPEGQ